MARYRNALPQLTGDLFVTYAGMETDLIFNQGIDLPGFASFPLLETESGRTQLNHYLKTLIDLTRRAGVGVILESHTWMANQDRGAALGYSAEALKDCNIASIELLSSARDTFGDLPTLISANVGPRTDAYAPTSKMSVDQAQAYHHTQIETLTATDADLISCYTIASVTEAIGMVRAAQEFDLPVVVAFTVETNGCLPTGPSLGDAINAVDDATQGYAAYFMINCAHPDHFTPTLSGAPWMARLKGIVANASRCSHAELDEATVLDDGNPDEFGQQMAAVHKTYPNINVLGGCCGTDMRHLSSILNAISNG